MADEGQVSDAVWVGPTSDTRKYALMWVVYVGCCLGVGGSINCINVPSFGPVHAFCYAFRSDIAKDIKK